MHSEIQKRRLNIIGRDLNNTKSFIEQGADINTQTSLGDNALFFSDAETTSYLIDKGIDINHTNKQGETAIFHSEKEALKVLINAGLDVNHTNNHKQNALFFVNDLESIDILVQAGININQIDSFGNNALMTLLPVLEENEERFHILDYYFENGLNINQVNNKGYNLLFVGGYQYAKYFIEKGIDINQIDNSGDSVLLFTLRKGFYVNNLKMVKLLIEHNIDINIPNDEDEIPLYYANTPEICEILIKAGADISNKNILFKHVFNNNIRTVQFLLENGFDINQTDYRGNKLLSKSKSFEMSVFLIDNGITYDEWDLKNCEPDVLDYIKNR